MLQTKMEGSLLCFSKDCVLSLAELHLLPTEFLSKFCSKNHFLFIFKELMNRNYVHQLAVCLYLSQNSSLFFFFCMQNSPVLLLFAEFTFL